LLFMVETTSSETLQELLEHYYKNKGNVVLAQVLKGYRKPEVIAGAWSFFDGERGFFDLITPGAPQGYSCVHLGESENCMDTRTYLARLILPNADVIYEHGENIFVWEERMRNFSDRAIPLKDYQPFRYGLKHPTYPEPQERGSYFKSGESKDTTQCFWAAY